MNGSPWNSQGVGQHCISCKNRLIYHHSVYSDKKRFCFSQGCDFWYEASHCLQHIVETPVTLQDYFFQKMPVLSWQPLFGTLTCQFLLTTHVKKVHHHFFDLIWILYMDTNWSNRSTPLICLLQSSKGFGIGTPSRFLADFDHLWALLTGLQVT